MNETTERHVPELPAPGERVRLLIDTDAATEVDDQFALALALHSPERFDIEGLVGAHLGDQGGPDGPDLSVAEIDRVLDRAGRPRPCPVLPGSHPLQYSTTPIDSPGVDLIIERAMDASDDRRLWIVVLGPITDVASAWLKCPEIADRVVVFYHARTTGWPRSCWNVNIYRDLRAARVVLASSLPLVLFDTGTYLRAPMEETAARLAPLGPLGEYLHEIRCRHEWTRSPSKAFYDLGDVATLVDPALAETEVVRTPQIDWDLRLQHTGEYGRMLRVYHIDRDGTFEMLYRKLAEARDA